MSYDPRWPRILTTPAPVTINSAATDVHTFVFPAGVAKWGLARLRVYDTSTTLAVSIATLGLYTGAGGTGTNLVVLATLTSLTSATKFVDMTLAVTADYQTATSVYLRCGTAHGSAATVNAALVWDWMG